MEDFKNILYPIALTADSLKVAPYVVNMAKKFDAQVHLLHVLRRFEWFVDTYVEESPKPDFKRIASDFESQILLQAQNKLETFTKKHLKGLKIANATVVLIIMGTGATFKKVMFGAVAEKVSRMANIPVMLIKSS